MTHPPPHPELLAPAGSPDALRAAVANGADAVYLGLDRLNARRGAANFSLQELERASEYAHLRGVRTYLTANVVVLPDEMGDALTLVDDAWTAGVDAVIVQDIGLLTQIATVLPHIRIHASTQIGTHNAPTLEELARLGVARVTLARETSLGEIASLSQGAVEFGIEVESFMHGALCVCYSGQCLLSSMVGGRSANRGQCAQPCRLPYELQDGEARALETDGAYLLSPRDLATLSLLPQLVAAGPAALKIEGRAKSPEYVAAVTGVYRQALDRVMRDPEGYEVRDGEMQVLSEAFSRGFTTGYLEGQRGEELMSYRRPNNRGVPIGRVSEASASGATLTLDRAVDSEDTIEFWTRRGRFAQRVGRILVEGREQATAAAGQRVRVAVEEPVGSGDRVFRIANAALLEAARRTYADPSKPPIEVAVTVRAVLGESLAVTLADENGVAGFAESAEVEAARTKAITSEEIAEHVGRLGGTPYEVTAWDIQLSSGVGISYSALHAVRRRAIEAYEAGALESWRSRSSHRAAPLALPEARPRRRGQVTLAATAASVELAAVLIEAGADEVHVSTSDLPGGNETRSLSAGIVPVLPRICHDGEVTRALSFAEEGRDLVVANLGLLRPAIDAGALVQSHWSLNVTNAWTARWLGMAGATRIWASPELNGRQLADVASRSGAHVGVSVFGRQELMVTEQCILASQGSCDRNCSSCRRRREAAYLRDRKGYRFPVETDAQGRSHVYNAVPLDLLPALAEVLATGVSAIRVDTATLSVDEATAAVRSARNRLREASEGAQRTTSGRASSKRGAELTTSGHFFRGVG